MKKTLLVMSLVLVLAVVTASAKKESWTGWISDSKCAAKGNKAEHAACAEKCIKAGAKAVFVNDKDGSVLEVTNQDAVTAHVGHHVTVTGKVDAAAKTLTADKVTMVREKAAGKKKAKAA